MVSRFWPTIILSATFINLINLHSWLVKNMAHWELPIDPYEINLVFRAITSFFSMSFFPRAKSCIKLDCLGLGVCVESRDRDKAGRESETWPASHFLQQLHYMAHPSLWLRAGAEWGSDLGPPILSPRYCIPEQKSWPEISHPHLKMSRHRQLAAILKPHGSSLPLSHPESSQ